MKEEHGNHYMQGPGCKVVISEKVSTLIYESSQQCMWQCMGMHCQEQEQLPMTESHFAGSELHASVFHSKHLL